MHYDVGAAAHGATEVGILLGILSNTNEDVTKHKLIRPIFEDERIPRHLGWEPRSNTREFSAGIRSVLDIGEKSLQADDPKVLRKISSSFYLLTRVTYSLYHHSG